MPRTYIKKDVRYNYSSDDFKLALEMVASGTSIREAASRKHVPYTTLNSHYNNLVKYDTIGRPTKFNKDEEDCLEQATLVLQKWGIPVTIEEFINLAKEYATFLNKSNLFPNGRPTSDWLYSFLNRHHNLIMKKSYPLEKKRAALTISQIDDWFELLNNIIQENNLQDRPAQIFNSDESGMSDNIGYSKVIVHRQTSNAYRIQGGSGKSYVSVMFCASATGFLLPPFVIYKAKRLFTDWCIGGPPNTVFETSKNGWMETTLFRKWFEHWFLEQTKHLPRPLLLIIDGHGSHFDVETLKLAVEHQV
ncbi:unnamed protein product [Adineta steineri]|uniref:Uncharacterized protein n=1 Tax=Adineta steineri TaxID=433720 RepID=A0A814NED5_9BILA|nr:unnamed protein product [Adineta steineri]CAF1284812.1 unnamed protein product [Adineta steineri]